MPDPQQQQTDPWVEAAKNFKPEAGTAPASGGNEDWKLWQQGGSSSAEPHGLLDTIRSNWQSNTQPVQGQGVAGAIHNIGGRAASTLVSPILHPLDTLKGAATTFGDALTGTRFNPDDPLNQRAAEFGQEWEKDKPLALDNLAGDVVGNALQGGVGQAISPALETIARPISESMKSGGGTLIDRAGGSTQADFKRGAQPGRSYLEGGGTPALTMRSLSDKAGKIANTAGTSLRDVYAQSSAKIPAIKVASAISKPLNEAHAVMSGPGGSGGAPIEELSASFRPSLQAAAQRGGLTPSDLFDLKHNVAKNTGWSDPTQLGLKQVRQQITGRIGGLLTDEVPEAKPLNRIYQGASNLQNRTDLRASTGSIPLSTIGRRAIEAGIGGGIGTAFGHPGIGLLAASADSVPGLTTGGYGLFKAGQMLPTIARSSPILTPLAGAAGIGVKPKTDKNKSTKD